MLSRSLGFSGSAIFAVTLALCASPAGSARADLGACGMIDLEAQAECEVVPPGASCEAKCTPVAVRASCDVQVAADCRPKCTKLPSVDCQGSCSASCEADCSKLSAGKFDCEASCTANCGGRCSGECSANSDRASCEASCKGSCSASCQASCTAEPPMADCQAGCDASCKGSCEVDPNLDCQLNCQAQARASCEAEVTGGCKVNCQKQDGAIFCSGQYVDHGDNLKMCIDALKAKYKVTVSGESSGSSSCDAGVCAAEGSAHGRLNTDCSVSKPGAGSGSFPVAAGACVLGLLAFVFVRRRGA